jgi:hypothetical protein
MSAHPPVRHCRLRDGKRLGDPVSAQSYRLGFRGELGPFRVPVRRHADRTTRGTTVLTGNVVDQAHLASLLEQIQELGLELVSVEPTGQAAGGW